MEWAKAKSIILVLLIVFNIFLLTRIVSINSSQVLSKETISNMQTILAGRNVVLETKIPQYSKNAPKIVFGKGVLDKDSITKRLLGKTYVLKDNSDSTHTYENEGMEITYTSSNSFVYINNNPKDAVDITRTDKTQKYIKVFLDQYGFGYHYVMDGAFVNTGSEVTYNYLEKQGGYLVFENYLKVKVSTNGITYMELRHRKVDRIINDRENDISSAYQILIENFKGNDKVVITGVDLGFKMSEGVDLSQQESIEQLPAWRIRIKGADKPRYFNASDGKEII